MARAPETPLFGDALALARVAWLRAMADRLSPSGYHDYRRSDALALRVLRRGPLSLGQFASALGASRQAARKVVSGLVERGYAHVEADERDARRRRVSLTSEGRDYARAVVATLRSLDGEVRARTDPALLAATLAVLADVTAHLAP